MNKLSPEEERAVQAEIEADKRTLLDTFHTTTKQNKPVADILHGSASTMAKDYENLHTALNKDGSTWTRYPSEFYDQTPREQEASIAFNKVWTDSVQAVCSP